MEGPVTDGGAKDILSRIGEALASRRSVQSPLYRWMMEHHDAFGAGLAQAAAAGRHPDWAALADIFAESGLVDGTGKAPNAANARRTWWRVKRRHARLHGSAGAGKASGAVPGAGGEAGRPDDVLAKFRSKVNERSGRKE